MKRHFLLCVFLCIALAPVCIGQDEAPTQDFPQLAETTEPTTITSEKFQLDLPDRKGLFIGSVVVEHPRFRMTSSEATVFLSAESKPERFIARGNVQITHGERVATARQAEYIIAEQKVILTGEPVVMEKQNRVMGNTIIIYPQLERMDVEGRTTVQIYP